MKRLWLVLMMSGCSLLFDPGAVPVFDAGGAEGDAGSDAGATGDGGGGDAGERDAGSPDGGSADASIDDGGADASTDAAVDAGFRFDGGFFTDAGFDGGDGGCDPIPAPAWLEATAGERSGRLVWHFPVVPGVPNHALCVPNLGCFFQYQDFLCPGGVCEVTVDGLPNNVRVTGFAAGLAACGREPTVDEVVLNTAAPLDTRDAGQWTIDTSLDCSTLSYSVSNDVFTVTQQGSGIDTCSSALVNQNDLGWGDVTIEGIITTAGDVAIGPAFHAFLESREDVVSDGKRVRLRSFNRLRTQEILGAEAPPSRGLGTSWRFRLAVEGQHVVYAEAPVSGGTFSERLRWARGFTVTGAVGVAARGSGTASIGALRVTSRGTAGPVGSATIRHGWAADLDAGAVSLYGNANVRPCLAHGPCPDGGCTPPAGSACVRLEPFAFFGGTALAPPAAGQIVNRPARIGARFAYTFGAFPSLSTLFSFRDVPLLRMAPDGGLLGSVELKLAQDVWHEVSFLIPVDGGVLSGTIDGVPWRSDAGLPTRQGYSLSSIRAGDTNGTATLDVQVIQYDQLP